MFPQWNERSYCLDDRHKLKQTRNVCPTFCCIEQYQLEVRVAELRQKVRCYGVWRLMFCTVTVRHCRDAG